MIEPVLDKAHRRRGFTLVELLVVIGIIGVLLSILIPALAKSRETANDIVCRSNLRQISLATKMYENENRDCIPDAYTLGGANFRRAPGEINPGDPTSIPEVFGPPAVYAERKYITDMRIWICPSALSTMQDYKNTYQNATLWAPTEFDKSDSYSTMHSSKLRGLIKNENVYWIGDNTSYLPYITGIRKGRTDNVSNLPSTQIVFPHKYRNRVTRGSGRTGSINMIFIDGQVGVVSYNLSQQGGSEVVRSP